jgi:aconitase B
MLTYPTPVPAYAVRDIDRQAIDDWTVSKPVTVETSTQNKTSHLKAAQLFQNAISTGTINVSQPGIEKIFLADLYRRAGDFRTACQILNQSQKQELEASLVKVLEYEQDLIQAQDIGYYQIAEALET